METFCRGGVCVRQMPSDLDWSAVNPWELVLGDAESVEMCERDEKAAS